MIFINLIQLCLLSKAGGSYITGTPCLPKYQSLLKAQLSHNPSFTWCSILEGREVMISRIAWRVGDSSNFHIKGDKWLTNYGESKIQDEELIPGNLHMVSQFIQNPTIWNRELIEQKFSNRDVAAILSIPLSHISQEDSLYWALN